MTQQSSVNLSLPFIQPAQAQKHVTHNEAVRLLDALVQGVVEGPPLATPPAAAPEGARWVVAEGATGAWAGRAGQVAWRTDGAWTFLRPARGWHFRVATGGTLVFDGTDWTGEGAAATFPDQVPELGIATAADPTNRLAVASDAVLLTHAGGGHQVKVNKAAETDTASLLFQTDWSGRAEMGTAGGDAFAVKVSADGASWREGLAIDPATGVASFPSGARTARRLDLGGRWALTPDNGWATFDAAAGAAGAVHDRAAGTGPDPDAAWDQAGPVLRAGATVTGVAGALRATSPEVTAVELRGYLHHADWDAGFDDDGDLVREAVFAVTVPTPGGWARLGVPPLAFGVPRDGFLVVHARAVGTLTATHHAIASIQATVLEGG